MKITSKMFQDMFKVHILKPTECVENFSCGDEDLDHFIKSEALAYEDAMLALTYVVTDKTHGCRFLTVDAYKVATTFYEKNGFLELKKSSSLSEVQLMYLDLKQAVMVD